MRFWNQTLATAIVGLAVTLDVGGAQAAVMLNFDQFQFTDGDVHDVPAVVTESGFAFTASGPNPGFEVFGQLDQRSTKSASLFTDLGGKTTLTKNGGGTFSFLSIDVA